MFGEWAINKNELVASIEYTDVFESYILQTSTVTAKANFTMVNGRSVVVPMIAQADFNEGLFIESVRIYLDTYELGKAM